MLPRALIAIAQTTNEAVRGIYRLRKNLADRGCLTNCFTAGVHRAHVPIAPSRIEPLVRGAFVCGVEPLGGARASPSSPRAPSRAARARARELVP